MMPKGTPLSKERIQKMREEVHKGKSKYRVAKEMGLQYKLVMKYTKDLPSVSRSDPCISGKSFELLKQLLSIGVVSSNVETYRVMRTMKRHLPMICFSRFNGKAVYYLDDQNKRALQALLEADSSKIISYQELGQMLRIFDVKVGGTEKKRFLGKKNARRTWELRESTIQYKFGF